MSANDVLPPICFLCQDNVLLEQIYDIWTTCTSTTNIPFVNLIQDVTKCKLEGSSSRNTEVCLECCVLLNELDYARQKVKNIETKLHSYLSREGSLKHAKTSTKTNIPYTSPKPEYVKVGVTGTTKHSFASENSFAQNDRCNNENNKYNCTVCNKLFRSKKGLSTHFRKQHVHQVPEIVKETEQKVDINEKLYELYPEARSDFCLNSLTHETQIVGKDDVVNGSYRCTKCGVMQRTRQELAIHMLSHDDKKSFICEICGRAFKHKSALDVHVGIHNGIKPFQCSFCNKTFTQKGALQRHIPIHTGEYPHQCDLCGKRFIHHTSFNIHQLSHTGRKDYKCDLCGLSLLSASHLKRHMRVHTGEKNFICTVCGKRFAERYNLVTHQKRHDVKVETVLKSIC